MADTAKLHAERAALRRALRGWAADATSAAAERARSERRTLMWGQINNWLHELKDGDTAAGAPGTTAPQVPAASAQKMPPGRPGPSPARSRAATAGPRAAVGPAVADEAAASARDLVRGGGRVGGGALGGTGLAETFVAELEELLYEDAIPELDISAALEDVRVLPQENPTGSRGIGEYKTAADGGLPSGVCSVVAPGKVTEHDSDELPQQDARAAADTCSEALSGGDMVDIDHESSRSGSHFKASCGTGALGATNRGTTGQQPTRGRGAAQGSGPGADGEVESARRTIREKLAGFVQRRGDRAASAGGGRQPPQPRSSAQRRGRTEAVQIDACSVQSSGSAELPVRRPAVGGGQTVGARRRPGGTAAFAVAKGPRGGAPVARVGRKGGRGGTTHRGGKAETGGRGRLRAPGRGGVSSRSLAGDDHAERALHSVSPSSAAAGGSERGRDGAGLGQRHTAEGSAPRRGSPRRCCELATDLAAAPKQGQSAAESDSDSDDDLFASPGQAAAAGHGAGGRVAATGAGGGAGATGERSWSGSDEEDDAEDEDDEFAWIMYRALPRQQKA